PGPAGCHPRRRFGALSAGVTIGLSVCCPGGPNGVEDVYRGVLPQLGGEVFLTDSGLETDLIFNQGFDLPEFASFVLVDDARGTAALEADFRRREVIVVQDGRGVVGGVPSGRASGGGGPG